MSLAIRTISALFLGTCALVPWFTSMQDRTAVADKAPEGIRWRTDLKAAEAEARRDRKPMFVVFRCEP